MNKSFEKQFIYDLINYSSFLRIKICPFVLRVYILENIAKYICSKIRSTHKRLTEKIGLNDFM